MNFNTQPIARMEQTAASADSYSAFRDKAFSGLVWIVEDEVARFSNGAGDISPGAPPAIWPAKRFLENLVPLLDSMSTGPLDRDRVLPLLVQTAEIVSRPFLANPQSEARAARAARDLEIRYKQRQSGFLSKGRTKLGAKYNARIIELFKQHHPAPGWMKRMREELGCESRPGAQRQRDYLRGHSSQTSQRIDAAAERPKPLALSVPKGSLPIHQRINTSKNEIRDGQRSPFSSEAPMFKTTASERMLLIEFGER